MSHSHNSDDPRFRIPRGSSDEEIDSDLASIGGDAPQIRSNKTKSTHEMQTSDDSDSYDSDSDDGVDQMKPAPTREVISETAAKLTGRSGGRDVEGDLPEDLSEDLSDDEDVADGAKLAAVTFAATQRRDLDRSKIRQARKVTPGVGVESASGVPVTDGISQKEMMRRMLKSLGKGEDGARGTNLAALEKKVGRLYSDGKRALDVPLPEVVVGRLDRSVAYNNVRGEVSQRWGRTVQGNRKKRRLEFPLNSGGRSFGRSTSDFVGKPGNEYEEEIENLLKEAGVSTGRAVVEEEDRMVDELGEATVSKEEVLKGRRELAKVRSLMFEYERKMKRIKKIKSKKYRRVLKRERERAMGDESDDEEERLLNAERNRAEERMRLRHKNTSKWVRRQLQRGESKRNPETKAAIEEQLRLHEELRRKQEGAGGSDSDSDDDKEPEELEKELEEIEKELHQGSEAKPKKGIMGMKFMQVAEEKKRKEALALLNEMGEENADDDDEDLSKRNGRKSFSGTAKVKKDRANVNEVARDEEDGFNDDDEDEIERLKKRVLEEYDEAAERGELGEEQGAGEHTKELKDVLSGRLEKALADVDGKAGFTTQLDGRLSADANPWLRVAPENGKRDEDDAGEEKKRKGTEAAANGTETRKTHESTEMRSSMMSNGKGRKEHKSEQKGGAKRKSMRKNDTNNDLQPRVDSEKPEKRRVKFAADDRSEKPSSPPQRTNVVPSKSADSDSEPSSPHEEPALQGEDEDLTRMQQIAQAFAGAGGAEEADFLAAKEAEVSNALPTAKQLNAEVLPGWGAWDGAGMSKHDKRPETAFARVARERLEAARKKAVGKRADRDMKHVILDEKRLKRATELTLGSVPFPYRNREEWEREVKNPLCGEFVSGRMWAKNLEGRIDKKVGEAIQPIRGGDVVKMKTKDKANEGRNARGRQKILRMRKERAERRERARRGLLS